MPLPVVPLTHAQSHRPGLGDRIWTVIGRSLDGAGEMGWTTVQVMGSETRPGLRCLHRYLGPFRTISREKVSMRCGEDAMDGGGIQDKATDDVGRNEALCNSKVLARRLSMW